MKRPIIPEDLTDEQWEVAYALNDHWFKFHHHMDDAPDDCIACQEYSQALGV